MVSAQVCPPLKSELECAGMKKLAIAIGGGILSVAYGILFIFLMARMIDHGGWWIVVGVVTLLLNHALMRHYYFRDRDGG